METVLRVSGYTSHLVKGNFSMKKILFVSPKLPVALILKKFFLNALFWYILENHKLTWSMQKIFFDFTRNVFKNAEPFLKLPFTWLGIFEKNSKIISRQMIAYQWQAIIDRQFWKRCCVFWTLPLSNFDKFLHR